MAKWTLPEGRKPMTDADMAALTHRLADTAIEQSERYQAAKRDAEEAEAYTAELEKDHDHWKDVARREGVCMSCRGPRGAPEPYGCTDCLNTGYCGEHHNIVADLEAKLAKAVVLLGQWRLASAGHVSVRSVIDKHDATLAELTGGKDDG